MLVQGGLTALDTPWLYFVGVLCSIIWQLVMFIIPLQLIYQCQGSLKITNAINVHQKQSKNTNNQIKQPSIQSNSTSMVVNVDNENVSSNENTEYEFTDKSGSPTNGSMTRTQTSNMSSGSGDSKIDDKIINNYIKRAIMELYQSNNKNTKNNNNHNKQNKQNKQNLSLEDTKSMEQKYKMISKNEKLELISLLLKQELNIFLMKKCQYHIFNAFLGL